MKVCTYEDIINTIKCILAAKGMKQVVVAERAGFSPQEFSNMLNERRKLLRVEYMPAIAEALDVDIHELYQREEVSKEDASLYHEI